MFTTTELRYNYTVHFGNELLTVESKSSSAIAVDF